MTPLQRQYLDMYLSGMTNAQICMALGKSNGTVNKQLRRARDLAGIPHPGMTKGEKDAIRAKVLKLHDAGIPTAEIAGTVRRTYHAVQQIIRRAEKRDEDPHHHQVPRKLFDDADVSRDRSAHVMIRVVA